MKLIFSQAITLTSAQPLKVTLGEDTQVLDEVVVTALGIKRATKALSYNVQRYMKPLCENGNLIYRL
ncbi:hypothetical protein F3B85_11520 [Bacteroides ovatus]|uniref:Uncharacterized protein n=1 Tax=Bacteroides ovatus TaxID=28116 RepID=A0A6L3GEV5_BACOV|nr:hypothetical protein F3B85_11520 [Bacteroides ovatus]